MPNFFAISACEGRTRFAGEQFVQGFEQQFFASHSIFLFQPGEHLLQQRQRPATLIDVDLRSKCSPVPNRRARARATHRVEPEIGPRRVSESVRGVWPSPENFSATRADTNATALFRADHVEIAPLQQQREKTLRQILRFFGTIATVASRIHKAATNKCGKVSPAPHQLLEIDPAPLAPRSNAWWRMRRRRFALSPTAVSDVT